jgi:N-methylhydantoinase A
LVLFFKKEHTFYGEPTMAYRLGVDVGGTFTDLLLLDAASSKFWRHKTPSTPADSSEGILVGVKAICAHAGISPSDIEVFLHGTTVATNAMLEGKGARVGLIVTEGYRQIMQIARSFVPGGLAGWIVWPKPTPLAALEDTIEIRGRMTAQGDELRPIDEAEIRAALQKLASQGVEAITVSLINAYMNGAHEARIGAIAAELVPNIPVSLSHVVLPEMQEYERTLTTVANAAVRPVVGRYVRSLRGRLRDVGMAGKISLLRSDGGLMSSEKSEEHPVSLLMSGPAGGVTGALWVAKNAGLRNILTLDVGGTSTDVALIEDLEPRRVRTTDVGHLSVRASSLDVKTVLHRLCADTHTRPARRPAIRRRRAWSGGLRQGWRQADCDRRERRPRLSSRSAARRHVQARSRGGDARRADHCRCARHRTDAGGARHHRYRQREHVRRAADDFGAARL